MQASEMSPVVLSPDSQNLHRNKRGMTIYLKSVDGVTLFLKLAMTAEVVVENF